MHISNAIDPVPLLAASWQLRINMSVRYNPLGMKYLYLENKCLQRLLDHLIISDGTVDHASWLIHLTQVAMIFLFAALPKS